MAVDFVVDAVMTALGLEGNEFQRPTIEFYVDEVNEYLKDAGVPEDVIGTKPTVGIVARGVADLWSYGAGNGKLSVYFKERAIQLATADFPSPEPTPTPGGELPPVTPADDGKVLTVVDGQWSPFAIPAELPEVTAAYDGKALMVVNGEWAAAELPEPTGEIFRATVTIETEEDSWISCSCNRTYAELYAAQSYGSLIVWDLDGISVIWDSYTARVCPVFGYWREEYGDDPAFFFARFYIYPIAYGFNPPNPLYEVQVILDSDGICFGHSTSLL